MGDEQPRKVSEDSADPVVPPHDVARAALARAKAAAQAKGLRPGAQPSSSTRHRADDAAAAAPTDTTRSGTTRDARDPQLLTDALSGLLRDRGWQEELSVGSVIGRWRDIVGLDVAEHCTPETLGDHQLVVRANSTAWATQMRLLTPTLLRRLEEEIGAGVVTEVKVLGPAGPGFKRGVRTVRGGRGPRDTWG
jgi:predicted nucleic acid-binding Zn ribbon protein